MSDSFTIADGKQVQADNLARWKAILQPSAFDIVKARLACAQDKRPMPKNGYDILRGVDVDAIVSKLAYELAMEDAK